ncbi:MAG: HEPN domain-containing protein [Candidatus Methanoperedens sp.]|nr:HEPN domain-containing protein [Candidatus Methanoperedens sp.]
MVQSREELVKWSLQKAEEYFSAASSNFEADRLYPAAEEIFRAVETALEALLYYYGIKKIEYPGKEKKFTGRLALQFLIRDNLVNANKLSRNVHNRYLEVASALHQAGYTQGKTFSKSEVKEYLKFAEDVLTLVKSIVGV